MEFHAAKCPNCGGALQLPDNLKNAKCMYCGADIIVRDAIGTVGANVENLLTRAASAVEADNYKEAYDYFTRVLEHEPQNHVALLGKAEAAGRLSTASQFRGKELKKGVEEAVASVPDEKKDEIKRHAVEIINKVCSNYSISLIGKQSDEVAIQREAAVECLEFAHNYAPDNPQIIESLVTEFNALRLSQEVSKARQNLLSIQTTGKPNDNITAIYDNSISYYTKKKEEYLSKLKGVAPDRAASYIENERNIEQNVQNVKGSGCLTTISLILLLVVGTYILTVIV